MSISALWVLLFSTTAAAWGADYEPHEVNDEDPVIPERPVMRREDSSSLVQDEGIDAGSQQAPAKFSIFKFTVTKTRSGSGPASYSEFNLIDANEEYVPLADSKTAEVVFSNSKGTAADPDPANVIDGSTDTSVLVQPGDFLKIRLLGGNLAVGAFAFKTSSGSTEGDPASFYLEASNDDKNWAVLSEKIDYLSPQARGVIVGPFVTCSSPVKNPCYRRPVPAPPPPPPTDVRPIHNDVVQPCVKYVHVAAPPAPPPCATAAAPKPGAWVKIPVVTVTTTTKTTITPTVKSTTATTTKANATTTLMTMPKPSPVQVALKCEDNATIKKCVFAAVMTAAEKTMLDENISLETANAASAEAYLLQSPIADVADEQTDFLHELIAATAAAGMMPTQQACTMSAAKNVPVELEVVVLDAWWAAHGDDSSYNGIRKLHLRGIEGKVAAVVKATADAGMNAKQQAAAAYKATIAAAKFYQHYENHLSHSASACTGMIQEALKEAQHNDNQVSALSQVAKAGFTASMTSVQIEHVLQVVCPMSSHEQEVVAMTFKASADCPANSSSSASSNTTGGPPYTLILGGGNGTGAGVGGSHAPTGTFETGKWTTGKTTSAGQSQTPEAVSATVWAGEVTTAKEAEWFEFAVVPHFPSTITRKNYLSTGGKEAQGFYFKVALAVPVILEFIQARSGRVVKPSELSLTRSQLEFQWPDPSCFNTESGFTDFKSLNYAGGAFENTQNICGSVQAFNQDATGQIKCSDAVESGVLELFWLAGQFGSKYAYNTGGEVAMVKIIDLTFTERSADGTTKEYSICGGKKLSSYIGCPSHNPFEIVYPQPSNVGPYAKLCTADGHFGALDGVGNLGGRQCYAI